MENTIDLQAERAAIAAVRAALNKREMVLDEATLVDDEAKHQALIVLCREAKDVYEQLDEETKGAQYKAQNTEAAYKRIQWDLEMFRSTRPQAESYPSVAELTAWQEELKAKVDASEIAEKASSDAWDPCIQLQHQRHVAKEKFQKLIDEELHSRSQLQGARQRVAARRPPEMKGPMDAVPDKQTIVFSMDSSGPRSANRMPMNMTPV